MAKSDRIVTRLEPAARARLHLKASTLGLDDAAFVRMLIYRELNGVRADDRVNASVNLNRMLDTVSPAGPADAPAYDEEAEPLPVEEMEIPPDADGGVASPALEELLSAAPSMLDDLLARTQPRAAAADQAHSRSTYRPASRGLQPQHGPGSRTRAVGINDMAVGSNQTGDGHGNVMRDNMRHFGIAGTRAR